MSNTLSLQYQDLLQLLVDARADSDDEDAPDDSSKKKLTYMEIVRSSVSFLLAGESEMSVVENNDRLLK